MSRQVQLWVRSSYEEFDERTASGLVEAVNLLQRGTLVTEVTSVRDLVLGPNGAREDGSWFTQAGLRQVLQWASPGAYQLVADIASGGSGRGKEPAEPAAAIEFYNRIVRLRADRFVGRVQLIRHVPRKTVDGLIGPGYVLYEHGDFLERSGEVLERYRLRKASLVGRFLSLRYVDPTPLLARGARRVHAGAHLTNSEVGGEASVRMAPCLVFEPSGSVFLGPPLGGRILHAGRTFRSRLAKAYALLEGFAFDAQDIERRLDALARADLDIVGDDKRVASRISHVSAVLAQRGVPKLAALRAIRSAVAGDADSGRVRASEARPGRTRWDLAAALARQAFAAPGRGEPLERAAYDLLFGKFHP